MDKELRKKESHGEEKDVQYDGNHPGRCPARFTASLIPTGTPRGRGKINRKDFHPSRKPFLNSRTKPIMP